MKWDDIIKKVSALYPDCQHKINGLGLKKDFRKTKIISKIKLEIYYYSCLWDNLEGWLNSFN